MVIFLISGAKNTRNVRENKRPNNPEKFLTEEKKQVDEAVKKAERETSSEIKLFIDRFCWGKIEDNALRVFRRLGLSRTKERNKSTARFLTVPK